VGIEWLPEESPVGESESNGVIESAIRELEREIRVLKSATQAAYKTMLGEHHPLLAWLIEHAGALLTRYAVGRDDRTRGSF
jgi:hypothetical protein